MKRIKNLVSEIRTSPFLIKRIAVIFDFHFTVDVFLMNHLFKYVEDFKQSNFICGFIDGNAYVL